jgi:hypothetical protein
MQKYIVGPYIFLHIANHLLNLTLVPSLHQPTNPIPINILRLDPYENVFITFSSTSDVTAQTTTLCNGPYNILQTIAIHRD